MKWTLQKRKFQGAAQVRKTQLFRGEIHRGGRLLREKTSHERYLPREAAGRKATEGRQSLKLWKHCLKENLTGEKNV